MAKPWAPTRAYNRQRQIALSLSNGICGIGDRPIQPHEKWHADHIVPASQGGSDDYPNLRITHATCNLRRGEGSRDGQPRLPGKRRVRVWYA